MGEDKEVASLSPVLLGTDPGLRAIQEPLKSKLGVRQGAATPKLLCF